MEKILIIHGPNLDLLGIREPKIYGKKTLAALNALLTLAAKKRKIQLTIIQSNIESAIVEHIRTAKTKRFKAIVMNPAAYTHTSTAIRDAVSACGIPVVEVHLSNIHAREEFRRISLIASACAGQISGFGPYSYVLGLEAAHTLITIKK